jgi:phospholipid transport system substrate-binding protein
MKKQLWIISLALAACCTWLVPAQAQSPKDYVRSILDRVMSIQSDSSLSNQARGQAIHRIIAASFDFNMMAKDSLGSTYGTLSASQRQAFNRTFSYLFQDSYTRMVLNFLKQENFKFGRESQEGNTATVATVIARTNENIPVTYRMHRTPQGWILFDVIVDGVSILHNYKTQFSQVIRTKSFQFLLDKMEQQRRAIQ